MLRFRDAIYDDPQPGNPNNGTLVASVELPSKNFLFRMNPATGDIINAGNQADRGGNNLTEGAGTDRIEIGRIAPPELETPFSFPTYDVMGITQQGSGLYAVTDQGHLIRIGAGELSSRWTLNPFSVTSPSPTIGSLVNTLPYSFTSVTAGKSFNWILNK